MPNCSPETVADVIEESSWTERAKLVEQIAAAFVAGAFDALEAKSAIEVFRVTMYDGEPLVRRVLAETLKDATALPRDIVLALAHDIAEVATPFLAFSPLLDAEELTAIARDGSEAHRLAIACRKRPGLGPQLKRDWPRHPAVRQQREPDRSDAAPLVTATPH
jgi:uncharacterized protein (DUF2336 family)